MYTEQHLAIDFIKAGITPLFLESSKKWDIRRIVKARGFEPEDLTAILERWNIEGARKQIETEKRRDYEKRLWAKKKEQTK
jgi:elongation factor P hydroxylase